MLGDEASEECLCTIFRNCLDMEDSVNSPTVALTNFSLSGVRLALFSALKASTGSSKRMLKYSLLFSQIHTHTYSYGFPQWCIVQEKLFV